MKNSPFYEGLQIELRLDTLNSNYYVFEKNYLDLKTMFDVLQGLIPDNTWHRAESANDFLELSRLLNNFLASTRMLVDFTRNFIKEYYDGTVFYAEYQQEVKQQFKDNKIAGFIEDLRNYAVHYQLPITYENRRLALDTRTGKGELTTWLILRKSQLLEWQGWTNKGKVYLQTSREDIPISMVITKYYSTVRDFHCWLIAKIKLVHEKELGLLEIERERQTKVYGRSRI